MNQKEFGIILGITGAAVSAYELGKNQPDFAMLERIASYFKVSVDYLLGRPDDPSATPPADELIVVFRGERQKLSPEYERLLIKIMEADAEKADQPDGDTKK